MLYQMHVLQPSFIYRLVLMFNTPECVEKTYRRALTSTRSKVQPSRAEVTLSKKKKKSNVGHVFGLLTCIFDEIYDNVDVLNHQCNRKVMRNYICSASLFCSKSFIGWGQSMENAKKNLHQIKENI